ncbi:MAG TPA: winged helix-turn-helix transcriptional regulator, partial [Candidatus Altiarchaeales archaeon]|nr:winged helix-turn-helix transcriptional regulator [Candidatus Altiarchaeales archaeon]
ILLFLFVFFLLRKTREKGQETSEELPDDLKEMVEIIKENGGRITQLELRKKLNYSESKISLMLADLERRGLIEKFKRGKGNIIILKNL